MFEEAKFLGAKVTGKKPHQYPETSLGTGPLWLMGQLTMEMVKVKAEIFSLHDLWLSMEIVHYATEIGILFSISLFVVSQTKGQDAVGNLVYHLNVLAVQPLTVTQGYNLEADDPNIHTDEEDMDSFFPRRQWADKIFLLLHFLLTSPQAADQAGMNQWFLKAHHMHIEILKSLGVDPWKECEQSKVENVVASVLPGVKKCGLCNREFHNTQKW